MATDERDAMFEKALARQLRGGASGDLRGATANCPDAEILGAYHEQSLTAAEMAECARHIPECARCQEILSQLEATDEVSMGTSADEDGKQARELRAPPMAMPRATRYWAAPLGAIAAGLVVWLGVNYEKEAHINQKATAEVAQNRVSAPIEEKKAPAAASAMDTPGSALREGDARSRGDLVAQKQESTGRDEKSLAKELPAANSRLRTPRMVAPASPSPRVEARSGVGGGVGGGVASGTGAATGSAGAKIVPPAGATESVEVTAAAPPQNGATDGAPKPAPPAVPSVTQTVTVESAAAPVAQTEAGEITADTHTIQSLPSVGRNVSDLMLLTPGVLAISAPGGNILWRVGHGGSVESSKDGGAHWKKQKSHVKADLSGGFAPSAEICWIVGPGTILRSVDGGAHWKKRASPIAGEIAGISAMDAQHATIWDANKKNMFVTADGGISWSAVAHN